MLYADYNAARPPNQKILAAYLEAQRTYWGNPSSPHHLGRRAKRAIEDARSAVASALTAKPSEIVFTSGASEANFLAILGVDPNKKSILLSRLEHPSVLSATEQLAARGYEVLWVDTPHQLPDAIQKYQPGIVSVMMAQNETGEIFPVAEVSRAAHGVGSIVHCDAVQAFGRIPVHCDELGVDLLSISGRKLSGVGSSGALYVRRGVQLAPLMPGSAESGRRAGTPATESIVAFGMSATTAREEMSAIAERLLGYKSRLCRALREKIPGLREVSAQRRCLTNTVLLLLPGCDGEDVVSRLDAEGVCVSTGAACTTGTKRPSHVLLAMGYSAEEARSSLRISLGPETTEQEIEQLILCLERVTQ
jgi:cysteine desulfurase